MPFANYKNFDECVEKNEDKEDPEAYCGEIKKKTEDKGIPKKDGSGKGKRANYNRGGCNDLSESRSKSKKGDNMTTQTDKSGGITPGFYDDNGRKVFINENGEIFEADFDDNTNKAYKRVKTPPTQNTEERCDMNENEREDLTEAQYEENYYPETKETKIDGSVAMMEARISKLQELTGKSREECSKEVKAKMMKKGAPVIPLEDMEEEEQVKEDMDKEEKDVAEEEEEDEEIEEEKKEDTLSEEELEALKKKAAIADEAMKRLDILEEKLESEEKAKKESEIAEKLEKLNSDFDVPLEITSEKLSKYREANLEFDFIADVDEILDHAIKRDTKEFEQEIEDMEDPLEAVKSLKDHYRKMVGM